MDARELYEALRDSGVIARDAENWKCLNTLEVAPFENAVRRLQGPISALADQLAKDACLVYGPDAQVIFEDDCEGYYVTAIVTTEQRDHDHDDPLSVYTEILREGGDNQADAMRSLLAYIGPKARCVEFRRKSYYMLREIARRRELAAHEAQLKALRAAEEKAKKDALKARRKQRAALRLVK